MFNTIDDFIAYFTSLRKRSVIFFKTLPSDQMEWAPKAGEFSCGDIMRHLAASEVMFAGVAKEGRWHYPGHERERAPTLEEALALLERCHAETNATLRNLGDAALEEERPTLGGRSLKVWRVLMMMGEHEIHHRSQFATYLTLMGIEPPQIYGMKLEEVIDLSDGT